MNNLQTILDEVDKEFDSPFAQWTNSAIKSFITQVYTQAKEEGAREIKSVRGYQMGHQHGRNETINEITALIDPYIENCIKAKEQGAMSSFGSASGGMMLESALKAFTELKSSINKMKK